MAKPVKVMADLSIRNGAGEIKVTNDEQGSLIFDFPNRQSLDIFTTIPLPFKPSLKAIGKTNAALLEQRQPVIVRVNQKDWLVLGRDKKATVQYLKFAPSYLKKQFIWKNALYILSSGIAVVLAYFLVKRQR
ncbi:hypothetical protein [Catalinimonas niigatensis]|uniref:hypothetical protein n=1 Tax=Catalinimonas niigatensis TaxID=1397264 RepID=UPI00266641AC|nr:hypothetical protein [Catalinimonas niigatensis]WPP49930.1 hypothetical protein PZB72_25015 [Catalinimonas niigatensis]